MGEVDKIDLGEFRAAFEGIASRDWGVALKPLHPEIVWYQPPDAPETTTLVGHDDVRKFWEEDLAATWDAWTFDLSELVPSDDQIVTMSIWRPKAGHSGLEFEREIWQVWTFKDGLAVEQRMFFTREEAFRVAGTDP